MSNILITKLLLTPPFGRVSSMYQHTALTLGSKSSGPAVMRWIREMRSPPGGLDALEETLMGKCFGPDWVVTHNPEVPFLHRHRAADSFGIGNFMPAAYGLGRKAPRHHEKLQDFSWGLDSLSLRLLP